MVFIKNSAIITLFMTRKFIDNKENPLMRPGGLATGKMFRRVEKESTVNIRNYLQDPNDEGIDDEGNTTIH